MVEDHVEIVVHCDDRAEMEDLSSLLNTELNEVQGKIEFASAPVIGDEADEKGMGLDWTTLLLTLMASGGVVVSIINLIQARLTLPTSITIKSGKEELSFSGKMTPSDRKMIEEFLKRGKKSKE